MKEERVCGSLLLLLLLLKREDNGRQKETYPSAWLRDCVCEHKTHAQL